MISAPQPPLRGVARLDLARRIEAAAGLARQLRSRHKGGAWRRTRRRLRRQLGRLADTLDTLQRDAFTSDPLDPVDLVGRLEAIDTMLADALQRSPTKADLQALRLTVREHRRALEAPTLTEPDPPGI